MNLLVLGAGGHGHVIKEIAESLGTFEKISFLDDNSPIAIGKLCEYEKYKNEYEQAFVAIGNNLLRNQWLIRLSTVGYKIPVLIHPNSYVSPSSMIKSGSVVMTGAIIQSNVKIGLGCIVSAGAIVDHDSIIENYCHVNAGAIIPSMTTLEEGTKVDYGIIYNCHKK